MAQYDVYRNPQPKARDKYPFVVDLQSGLLGNLPTRLVAPLSTVGADVAVLPRRLCPAFEIEGRSLILMPQLAAPLSRQVLGTPVSCLDHASFEITSALDAVLSSV